MTPSGLAASIAKPEWVQEADTQHVKAEALEAQAREIDSVLVTELTRWGRSTQDLMDTLGQLASRDVSLIAPTGLTFDLSTPQGKLIANLMASLAEFEHDLLCERVRSGIARRRRGARVLGASRASGRPKGKPRKCYVCRRWRSCPSGR